MKRIVLVFVFILVVFACTSCASERESKLDSLIGEEKITFDVEGNKDQLGSYVVKRSNLDQEWYESGSWSNELELMFDSNKNICTGYLVSGTFRAMPGYKWVRTRSGGRDCLKLTKGK